MKQVTLFKHVSASLNVYRWITAFMTAIIVSVLFSGLFFNYKINSDKKIISALSPYLSTLVVSSDRPELMRVLKSVSSNAQSQLVLIQDDMVLASTRGLEELDRSFVWSSSQAQMLGAKISGHSLFISEDIKSPNQNIGAASVVMISDLSQILWVTLAIFCSVLFLSFGASLFLSYRTQKTIKKALAPLEQLQSDIKSLIDGKETETSPLMIAELEDIRNTVAQTKNNLDNAKDKLAEVKAKKLSAEAYKSLIHDLHNPVAALRQMVSLSQDETVDAETKTEAMNSLPRITDQILNQVTAAKKNLEENVVALRELNIIECVKDSVNQIKALESSKKLLIDYNADQVLVPHDPNLLKRALTNLIENGLEAASSEVMVSVKNQDRHISIFVSDDGQGMDESLIPIYFQGRGQSGKANRQALGLSSTNHIVKSHGGKLIYRKNQCGGSSFEIRLEAL